jgi:hypothetical protein
MQCNGTNGPDCREWPFSPRCRVCNEKYQVCKCADSKEVCIFKERMFNNQNNSFFSLFLIKFVNIDKPSNDYKKC